MEKRRNSQTHKWPPGAFDLKNKVFSWSAYHVWTTQGPAEFAQKYIYGGADYMNPRMMTGRIVAEMIESDKEQEDPTLEHLRAFLPRYQHQEYELEVPFNGLTLVMHLDGFDEPHYEFCDAHVNSTACQNGCTFDGKIGEYKTGVKWNKEMVAKWEQLDWYALGVHLKFNVNPSNVPIVLTWMPTVWAMGDAMPKPTGEIHNFEARRDLRDCLEIGNKIMKAWKQIEKFCEKERAAVGM